MAQRKGRRIATSGGGEAAAQKGGETRIATVAAAVIGGIHDGKRGAAAGVGAGREEGKSETMRDGGAGAGAGQGSVTETLQGEGPAGIFGTPLVMIGLL